MMNIKNYLLATAGFLTGLILSMVLILTIAYLIGFLTINA